MKTAEQAEDAAWKELRRRTMRGESITFHPDDSAVQSLERMKARERGDELPLAQS